jgi:trimethylamine monooxygenase
MVNFCEKSQKFTLTAQDLSQDKTYSEEFDFVICASGHFSIPHIPTFEGIETFNGRILHSHDFRNANEFKG